MAIKFNDEKIKSSYLSQREGLSKNSGIRREEVNEIESYINPKGFPKLSLNMLFE
jgi:hypothetical protein